MARKPRVVPFVPFPRDGDLDGLVQDGTIWERPKGAYLRFIDTGEIWSEYGQVDRGRVEFVRADGSVWDFTPSWRDTDSSTLGGSLGTLGDDSPSLLESRGILPRGFLGRSLADESRFDDAGDDVRLAGFDAANATKKLDQRRAYIDDKIAGLLLPEAVESGLITQETQDKLRALYKISVEDVTDMDAKAVGNRQFLFLVMEGRLFGNYMDSPEQVYESLPLGTELRDMLKFGGSVSFTDFSSRLNELQAEARRQNRSVADVIGPIDENNARLLQTLVSTIPVTTWHDHHIKELIDAYVSRDFDKVRYHADWLTKNTSSLEDHLGYYSQLQYMVDNPELLDNLFRKSREFKDYDYLTGYTFRRKTDDITGEALRTLSDKAARRADKRIGISSSKEITSDSRFVERAGELSGQYQDLDVITQVLRDIEIAELEIQRLNSEGDHVLADQFRVRLAELRAELKDVTTPRDIEVKFDAELQDLFGDSGILSYIPGGLENEGLLRKIKTATDGLSPEFRPKEIRIGYVQSDDGKRNLFTQGSFNHKTGVLTLSPRVLGLEKDLVIDRKNGTIRRFGPDDGPDGVELPLGVANTPELEKLLSNIKQYQITSLRSGSLEEVAIHETVHRIDTVLSADAFFRNKSRLEADIGKITAEIDAIRGDNARKIPSEAVPLLVRRRQMQSELRSLERQRKKGSYAAAKDSPIRLASQQWIDENTPWLEAYAEELELAPTFSDQAYLLSILGYDPNWDFIAKRFGYKRDSKIMPSKIRDRITTTDRVETLAEVISSQVLGDRRIPAGTSGTDSHLPEMLDNYAKQIIPEELKFILSDPNWRDDQLPPLTALAGRQELDIAYATPESLLEREPRGSLLPMVAGDPSATSQMLSDAASEDRYHRILGELAQAEIDEPELFRDGVLVDSVRSPFSPPPHLAGSGLRDELAEATSWREVSQLLKGKRVVVFDTETAGRMDPDEVDEDRIVQLGGVVYVDGVIVDRFSMYVNVDYDELSDWSQENLIDAEGKPMSPEFLAKQPDMPTVLQEFMRFANGDSDGSDVVFMAHNAAFDLKRMELERQRHDPDGVPSFDLDEVTYFDTMGLGNIAKRAGIEDGPGSASLKKLQEFFGLEDFSWHTADADSEMTGQVLWRLLDYMDENDVPLDGLDPVAGLERQREEFAEYDGKVAEFLRQKERLAELRGLSDQLRADSDDAVSEMVVMGYEGLDGGEEIPVRDGLHVHMDGYVPEPVTRDDIARQLGFADAGELDAATADDPVMANNARILEELASYGFSLERMNKLSAEEWEERRAATLPKGNTNKYGQGKPLDDAELDSIFVRFMAENEERIKEIEANKITAPDAWDTPSQNRELAWRKAFIETYESLTFEERKQLVVDYLRNIFDDPDTTVALNSQYIRSVFRDGINKNSHYPEVRAQSSSWGGPGSKREAIEASLMGVHADAPPELHPTYGFIVPGEQRRLARNEALEFFAPVKIDSDDGSINTSQYVSAEARLEIVGTLMPEVLEELFPGVQKISDLPNDADKETAVAALNDKIFERSGLGYLTEEGRLKFNDMEVGMISVGAVQGGGTMMLDPKVLLRSSASDGDSINNMGSPVPISANMTEQDLLEMVFKRSSGGPPKLDPTYFFAALSGSDSTVLSRGPIKDRRQAYVPTGSSFQYLEAQIFGNFLSDEVIAADIPYIQLEEKKKLGIPEGIPDLTPESEVAAIKAQRAAERAGQSIDAVAADAAATIDDLDDAGDEVVSFMALSSDDIDPNFGLPPGPKAATGWDKERLYEADGLRRKDAPNVSAINGSGLREDQRSLVESISDIPDEDLEELRKALRAVEAQGIRVNGRFGQFIDNEIWMLLIERENLAKGNLGASERRVKKREEFLALALRDTLHKYWGSEKNEVFHWDFLSERVQKVLGEDFGISVQHERRDPPSEVESIQKLQELLTPLVDAWARGQYAATQQYLKDNNIREVNLYRGIFVPTARTDNRSGTVTSRGVSPSRGIQSWSSDLTEGLKFAGNEYNTAKRELAKIEDSGEFLGQPEHILLHDVVPAELIFGIAYSDSENDRDFSFGIADEDEVVVLGGASRPVNIIGDDFLQNYQQDSPPGRVNRESKFRMSELDLFAYLASEAEVTQLDNLSSADELTGVDDLTASIERIQEQFPSLQDQEIRLDSGARIFYDMETDLYFALDDSGDGPTEIQTFESFDDFVYSIDTSELEEQALQDWREGDAKRTVVFHGTTAEALETIRTEGLNPRSDTRGIVNRGVGDAVYTSETADVAEASYDVVVEIDLPRAIEDGVISVDSLDREPDVIRNEVLEGIAISLDAGDFVPAESIDGTRPDTVVISDRIPPEYLLVNGEPLVPQSVSKATLPDSVGRETFSGSAITPRSLEEVKDTLYYLIGSQDFEEAERVSGMSREEFEAELTSRVSKYLADSLKDGSLSMRMPGSGLRELLAGDGRFKNQFETGRSQAYFDPSFRRALEEGLGVDETVEGALRPKYGYVEGTIWDEAETRVIIDQYGDVNIRFKDEVADRTTVSFGDTLDDSVFGVRISDLRDGSVDPERLGNAIEEFSMANVWLENDTNLNSDGRSIYAELQFHGILGLEDVDEIVLTTGTKKFETREEADAFFKVIQDAGITLKFGDFEDAEEVVTAENLYDYLVVDPESAG